MFLSQSGRGLDQLALMATEGLGVCSTDGRSSLERLALMLPAGKRPRSYQDHSMFSAVGVVATEEDALLDAEPVEEDGDVDVCEPWACDHEPVGS